MDKKSLADYSPLGHKELDMTKAPEHICMHTIIICEPQKSKYIVPSILYTICTVCCSVTQSCLTLWDPMDCSTPGFSVPHLLPKFAQVHVHCIGGAIQSSHPQMPSSSALNLSQHQGTFQWVSCSHQMTIYILYDTIQKVLLIYCRIIKHILSIFLQDYLIYK